MCGIAAIYNIKENKSNNLNDIRNILRNINHRGPDDQRHLSINNCHLGIARLSIIDLKNGNQPIIDISKRYYLVFNGEIYNFLEIKEFLKTKKIKFITNSDTEVLVNSFNYWGKKCFNYFDGMWAVAIYDFKKKTTYISRDYLGQKPLFYNHDKDNLIFSSQINGIFQIKKNFEFSKENTLEYFKFNHYPSPLTGYKNLFQVSPGEILELKINH